MILKIKDINLGNRMQSTIMLGIFKV